MRRTSTTGVRDEQTRRRSAAATAGRARRKRQPASFRPIGRKFAARPPERPIITTGAPPGAPHRPLAPHCMVVLWCGRVLGSSDLLLNGSVCASPLVSHCWSVLVRQGDRAEHLGLSRQRRRQWLMPKGCKLATREDVDQKSCAEAVPRVVSVRESQKRARQCYSLSMPARKCTTASWETRQSSKHKGQERSMCAPKSRLFSLPCNRTSERLAQRRRPLRAASACWQIPYARVWQL